MKKIGITIAASLALIVLIKASFPEQDPNPAQVRAFWLRKTFAPAQYNLIACGDSRIYRGISTEAIREGSAQDWQGINLGYASAGFSIEYLNFVVSKFDPQASNRTLLLGVTPHSFTSEALRNEQYFSFQEISRFEQIKETNLAPLLAFFAPYRPTKVLKRKTPNEQEVYNADGWVASNYVRPDTTDALISYRKAFADYRIEKDAVEAFLNKVEEMARSGITLVAFRPPSTYSMRALEDELSGFNEAYIRDQLTARGVIWLEFSDSDFNSYDGSHLNAASAIQFSTQLGLQLDQLGLHP